VGLAVYIVVVGAGEVAVLSRVISVPSVSTPVMRTNNRKNKRLLTRSFMTP